MSILQEKLAEIADAIRAKTGSIDLIKPSSFANEIDKVYTSGKTKEYNNFWNTYQKNGTRTNYYLGFRGIWWTNDNFKPKYPLKPTDMNNCFTNSLISGDLTEMCELDTSNCTMFASAFTYTLFTRIGTIDFRKGANTGCFAYSTQLETIDKIIFTDDGTQGISNYTNCSSLKNIRYEGKVGINTNFQWCPLTAESIVSVVEALWENASGLTATFSQSAVKNADWSATAYESWDALIATRQNWTFNLV